MERLRKDYICPIVYEATKTLPGSLCRIIRKYISLFPFQYRVGQTTIEFYDLEEVLQLCYRGNRYKGHQPKKFWTWPLMKQLPWIIKRLNWRCTHYMDSLHFMYSKERALITKHIH